MREQLPEHLQPVKDAIIDCQREIASFRDYIRLDAHGIEDEINGVIRPRLKMMNPGCNVYKMLLKQLFMTDEDGRQYQVTDFDGAFIVSNLRATDRTHASHEREDAERAKLRRENAGELSGDSSKETSFRSQHPVHFMVIVEAKHNMTRQRINNKLETLSKIQTIIANAKVFFEQKGDMDRNPHLYGLTSNVQYQLHKIDNVLLYFGAPVWEDKAVSYIRKITTDQMQRLDRRIDDDPPRINEEEERAVIRSVQNKLGIIVPSGNRYYISDVKNKFEAGTDVEPLEGGGRKMKKLREVRSFRQRFPVTFS